MNDEEFMSYTVRCIGMKIKIVRTKKEYMETCIRKDQGEDDCKNAECPLCFSSFINNGHLTDLVMFHKGTDSAGNEMWVHPIHVVDILRHLGDSYTTCAVCRKDLVITPELKEYVKAEVKKFDAEKRNKSAIKLQRVVRCHNSRKLSQNTRRSSKSKGGGGRKKMKSVKRIKRLRRVRRISRR